MKQTAVEWLYEKLEYVNWMRNRDEISAGIADEWRKDYLEQAKAMEKEQIRDAFNNGMNNSVDYFIPFLEPNDESENYYNETYSSERTESVKSE